MPAVVDEIVGRTEFLTPVWGSAQSDFGRNQAWFEYASQLGELLNMEVVGLPVYSWGCAIGHAMRMAARLTGRREIVIAAVFDPERLSVIGELLRAARHAESHRDRGASKVDPETGLLDLDDLKAKLSSKTAAVYFEMPVLSRPVRDQRGGDRPHRPAARRGDHRRRRSALPRHRAGRRRISAPTSWSARPSRWACT